MPCLSTGRAGRLARGGRRTLVNSTRVGSTTIVCNVFKHILVTPRFIALPVHREGRQVNRG